MISLRWQTGIMEELYSAIEAGHAVMRVQQVIGTMKYVELVLFDTGP